MAKIFVQNTQITIIKQNEDDYISLTDMLKAKDGEFFFSNWLRNRNTIEFLGIWERLMNPNFNCAEFDIIKSQAGLNRFRLSAKEWTEKTRITGSVLLITFEVFVLHIVPDPLCTSIGSIVFKCEGKDTNLFSNIQIFNAEK